MNFKCSNRKKKIGKSYDVDISNADLIGRPWYTDDTGLNHMAIMCLYCGTIHDCIGANPLISILTAFRKNTKTIRYYTLKQIKELISLRCFETKKSQTDILKAELKLPNTINELILSSKFIGKGIYEIRFGRHDSRTQEQDLLFSNTRFTDNENGTVTDTKTGLMWTKNADPFGQSKWDDSIARCNSYSISGIDGWRLPNKDELEDLYYAKAGENPFIEVQSFGYWSSSTNADDAIL